MEERFNKSPRMGKGTYILVDSISGCWIWQGTKNNRGYGCIVRDGLKQSAHRWFYKQVYGEIPKDRVLDHLCRDHLCVNPTHLEPVTSHENTVRGLLAKLTWADVDHIRALHARGIPRPLIRRLYRISSSHCGAIIQCKVWRRNPSGQRQSEQKSA